MRTEHRWSCEERASPALPPLKTSGMTIAWRRCVPSGDTLASRVGTARLEGVAGTGNASRALCAHTCAVSAVTGACIFAYAPHIPERRFRSAGSSEFLLAFSKLPLFESIHRSWLSARGGFGHEQERRQVSLGRLVSGPLFYGRHVTARWTHKCCGV